MTTSLSAKVRVWILSAVFFAVAIAVWSSLFTTSRFARRDAYDYAQLGRQIRTHQGFTTRQLFPRDIPYLHDQGYLDRDQWPSLHRYPLPPVTAAFFQLFSTDIITAAVVQSGIFFLLSVPFFFLLAVRLTGVEVASLATLLYMGDPRLVRSSYDGMTESLAALLLLLLFHVAFRPQTLQGRGSSWLLLGFLCGLAYLTRTQLIFLLPLGILLALLAVAARRIRSALLLLAGMIVTVSPWLARNYVAVGNPFFTFTNTRALLAMTESYHQVDLMLNAPVAFPSVLESCGQEILEKIWHNIWPNLVEPRFWLGTLGIYAIVFPLFALGVFLRKEAPPRLYALFEVFALVFCLADFLMVSTTYHRPRYYDTLIPFLILVISWRIWWLIAMVLPRGAVANRRWHAVAVIALFSLALLQAVATWTDHATTCERDPREARAYEILAARVSPTSIIASDLSLEITVHTGNRTIRLPIESRDVFEIDDKYLTVDYIVFGEKYQKLSNYKSFIESADFQQRYRQMTRLPNEALVYERTGSATSRPSAQELPATSEERYYPAQLHLHGSLSEGAGTMHGHNAAARRVGIEVLWWTDHDWRIARHTYLKDFDFEFRTETLTIPQRKVPWKQGPRTIKAGWTPELSGCQLADHAAHLTEAAPERGRSLELRALASPDAEDWGWSEARISATGRRFNPSLAAGVVLRLAVRPGTPSTADAQGVVRLELSRQLDGVAELWYVLGEPGQRRIERHAGGRVGIVPLSVPAGTWSEIALPVTQDAVDLDLGGWDNSLRTLRLGVRVRRGAMAAARFDDLRILTELDGQEVLARQELMALKLTKDFGLVNHVGSEISYSFHMGAYLPRIELPDFERYPSGMSPRQIVAWAHERGGLASYNHVFGTAISVTDPEVRARLGERGRRIAVENRVFGADLLEVGYPQRVEPLIAHLGVWDELSAERVFLTAIGSSDSHDQETGWFDGNNFVTWIWAKSPQAEDLIEGLRQGRAFLGDPTRFHGTLDLETEDGVPAGQVVRTDRPHHDVRLRLTDLPENTTIRWIVHGEEAHRLSPPGGDFETTFRVDTRKYRFIRAEVWLGAYGLAFSNCLYFVPTGEAAATHSDSATRANHH